MKMLTKVVFLSCVLVVGCFNHQLANAQQRETRPDQEPTLKIDTALVSVPVIVSDQQGRYISGLKASDFSLYEDRVKQAIDFFADTEEPINVALLLDTSKSTTMVLDDIKNAAKDFVKQLRPQDRAMIVSFDFHETALCELTSDRKTLEKAIGKARIGETVGTKLRDAVYDVMSEEFRAVKGRKAIILLTDGKDHGSDINERILLDAATEADTLIYSVFYRSLPPNFTRRGRGGWGRRGGIFTPLPPPRQQRRRERMEERSADAIEFLQQLSDVSAGRYFDSEVAKLKETFVQIVEELRHQYRLGFYPSDHPAGSVHSLKVQVERSGVVVRSRRSYRVATKP
ncbi:MAG: VWA domain-containing protein [Acidobacteria bacterium]|nr:VWA domain-containing protein [Acidobacteriota bacterium]